MEINIVEPLHNLHSDYHCHFVNESFGYLQGFWKEADWFPYIFLLCIYLLKYCSAEVTQHAHIFCYFSHWENCSHLLLAKIHWSPISNHVQVPDHQVILLAINHESACFKPANPKGNQPWIFIGRTVAEAEPSILRPPSGLSIDAKCQVIGKDPDARKDWAKMRNRQQKMRWLDSLTNLMNINLTKIQEIVDRGAWCATVHGVLE